MTTDPNEEYGEVLRRALRAEAESVMPAPDGLERIRARIDERSNRRFGWAWFTTGWQRPALAIGAAAFIVALGVSAPQTFDRMTSTGDKGPAGEQGRPPVALPNPTLPDRAGQTHRPDRPGQSTTSLPGNPSASLPGAGSGITACHGGDEPPPETVIQTPGPPLSDKTGETPNPQPCPEDTARPTPSPTGNEPVTPSPTPTTPDPTTPPPSSKPGENPDPG